MSITERPSGPETLTSNIEFMFNQCITYQLPSFQYGDFFKVTLEQITFMLLDLAMLHWFVVKLHKENGTKSFNETK